jgi:hypothetical protein
MKLPDTVPDYTLLLVWNADGRFQNRLKDALKKIMMPDLYPCDLCKITHGVLGPKQEWHYFLQNWGKPIYFMHKDEFLKYRLNIDLEGLSFPMILVFKNGTWNPMVTTEMISKLGSLTELMQLLQNLKTMDNS